MKIAIIGCGQMGRYYAANLVQKIGVPRSSVTCSDIVPERAQKLASDFGINHSDSLPLAVDAAIVAVNTPAHASIIEVLAQGGVKHILCEKPLGLNHADIQRIENVAAETGAIITTALVINFSGALPYLRELMRDERLHPLELYGSWGKPRPLDKTPRPSAGDVEDEAIHPIATCLSLFSSIRRIDVEASQVGMLPFVDSAIQNAARDRDHSFPSRPNHSTSVLCVVHSKEAGILPVNMSIRSSFLLAKQERRIGGVLGEYNVTSYETKARYAFEIDFDLKGEDVLTLTDLTGE